MRQPEGREHVGAGSEPAPTTGKKVHSSWRVSSSRAEQIAKFYRAKPGPSRRDLSASKFLH